MTPDAGSSKLTVNRNAFLSDLQEAIDDTKTPVMWTRMISAFVAIYAAGISVAGTHAWAWSALPATLAALVRLLLHKTLGHYVHEDVVREIIANNITKGPAPRITDTRDPRFDWGDKRAAAPPPSRAAAPPGDTAGPTAAHP